MFNNLQTDSNIKLKVFWISKRVQTEKIKKKRKKKINKRRINGASRSKLDLTTLAYRERNFRKRERKVDQLWVFWTCKASQPLTDSAATKRPNKLQIYFLFPVFLFLFISNGSLIMTQPNARFLVKWPPLIRPLTVTSSSPRSKNQVLNKLLSSKQWRKEKKKWGDTEARRVERDTENWGKGRLEKRKEKNRRYLYHATTRVLKK